MGRGEGLAGPSGHAPGRASGRSSARAPAPSPGHAPAPAAGPRAARAPSALAVSPGPIRPRFQKRRSRRSLVTPFLVGLCAVLMILAACLVAALVLLQSQFKVPAGPAPPQDPDVEVEANELWIMDRVMEAAVGSDPKDPDQELTLEKKVSWLLRRGELLHAARLIVQNHRKQTKSSTAKPPGPGPGSSGEDSPVEVTVDAAKEPESIEETETISTIVDDVGRVDATARAPVVAVTPDPGPGAGPGLHDDEPWTGSLRLPRDVRPEHYDLLLRPNLAEGSFSGSVNITVRVDEPRKDLWLHSDGVNVNSVLVYLVGVDDVADAVEGEGSGDGAGNSTSTWCARSPGGLSVEEVLFWTTGQFVVIRMGCLLAPGTYLLQFTFSSPFHQNEHGFYRSSYFSSERNTTRFIATSKFEPTYARLSFPCFDEPAMKATFSIRLVRPSQGGYVALSNTNVQSEVPDPATGLTTVQFTPTVKMSTYLAVFIVCDFVTQLEPAIIDNIPLRVYARPEQINNTKVAHEVAQKVLSYYVDYFSIKYPMPKIDLIAIPDFVSGAMENWGLITFRETSLLFDPEENSAGNQLGVSETVAHELAHMWFGNLVTMKWWTDLWLNEGFATFMSFKGLHHTYPDWDVLSQFVVSDLHSVLKLDAVLSSHPVLQVVEHPDQITEIFDLISYEKGSSVIRMLEGFMGEQNFAKGLHGYLETHKFGNAETDDLWSALQTQAPENINVKRVMDTWTRQMGYPLVSVKQTSPGVYSLSQKRFLADPEATFDSSESPYGYKWEIPITFSTSLEKENNKTVWLSPNKDSFDITVNSETKWIKLNRHQVSYYRTTYDDDIWKAFISALSDNIQVLDPADRANLLDDAFNLADAQVLQYDIALNLSRYLSKENHYVPWVTGGEILDSLREHLPNSTTLQKYGCSLLRDISNELTWSVSPNDGHLRRRLRVTILDLACSLKEESALKQANSLFTTWLDGGDKPHPDVRAIVYQYGLDGSTDEEQWNQVLEKYMNESNAQEKVKLMFSLAKTSSQKLLKKYLDLAKNESIVRSQNYFTVLSYIADNPMGTQLVWDFYRNEWNYLVERFSLNDRIFGRFILRVTKRFNTMKRLEEVETFLQAHPEAGAGAAARKQALEMIRNNIKWTATHSKKVELWLKNAIA